MGRPRTHIDPTGRYGRLLAEKEVAGTSYSRRFQCLCDCGKTVTVNLNALLSGNTKSCGCLKKDLLRKEKQTHGMSKTLIYGVWKSMKDRCFNSNIPTYKNYGGRGICMCREWVKSFKSFYGWAVKNGYKKGLTIERIDNDGDYCPDNCTFIPKSEQSKNRRNLNILHFDGKSQTLSEWSREIGISRGSLRDRLSNGWPIEEALTTKKLKHRRT